MKVKILGGSYRGRSVDANPEVCINLFPEVDVEGGRSALVGTPGLVEITNLTEGEYDNLLVGPGDRLLVAPGIFLRVSESE